jgi:hypothetical protein
LLCLVLNLNIFFIGFSKFSNINYSFSSYSDFFNNSSNNFLNSNNLFSFSKKILSDSQSVHSLINSVKGWNTNITYFLKLNILRSFNIININRLKNIFCKQVKDFKFWIEIQKMIVVGLIDLSADLIYKNQDFYKSGLLSSFLLDVYFSELDIFLKDLSIRYNSKFSLYNSQIKFLSMTNLERQRHNVILKNFIPLKLEKKILNFKTLNGFNLFKSRKFINTFKVHFLNASYQSFDKAIYFVRYLHHILLGVVGSKNFSISLKNKIYNFVEGNLHFRMKDSILLSKFDSFIFFLGFNISCSIKRNFLDSFSLNLKINKKYKLKILSRLNFYKFKMSKLFINRVYSELFFNIVRILQTKNISYSSFEEYKVWIYIFQLESIRCSNLSNLILSKEDYSLLSPEIFSEIKLSKFINYQKYFFKLYLKKLSFAFKSILEIFPSIINKSTIPIDLSVNKLFDEFNKRLNFLYENFNINDYETFTSSFNYVDLRSKGKTSDVLIDINIPIKYFFEKLRILGFVHPNKKRPIGNTRFLLCDDIYIIKYFGYLANSFLFWFRICDNFFIVKILIEFIRQSCFLTLCRKHNKNKNWAYSVYTPNLVMERNLYIRGSFFPSRHNVLNFHKKFFNKEFFIVDEDFFINL